MYANAHARTRSPTLYYLICVDAVVVVITFPIIHLYEVVVSSLLLQPLLLLLLLAFLLSLPLTIIRFRWIARHCRVAYSKLRTQQYIKSPFNVHAHIHSTYRNALYWGPHLTSVLLTEQNGEGERESEKIQYKRPDDRYFSHFPLVLAVWRSAIPTSQPPDLFLTVCLRIPQTHKLIKPPHAYTLNWTHQKHMNKW